MATTKSETIRRKFLLHDRRNMKKIIEKKKIFNSLLKRTVRDATPKCVTKYKVIEICNNGSEKDCRLAKLKYFKCLALKKARFR